MSEDLTEKELDKYGFVVGSNRRKKIVLALRQSPFTPKQLSERTKISLSHMSNLLKRLRDEDMVKCVNPERKKGRVYKLTDLGKKIGKKVDQEN